MRDHPFSVGVDGTLAFGVAVISHNKWVPPFAVVDTVLGNGASDINVVFVDLVVHDCCLAHSLQCVWLRPRVPPCYLPLGAGR